MTAKAAKAIAAASVLAKCIVEQSTDSNTALLMFSYRKSQTRDQDLQSGTV